MLEFEKGMEQGKRYLTLLILILILPAFMACTSAQQPPGEDPGPTSTDPADDQGAADTIDDTPSVALPDTKKLTVTREGMAEDLDATKAITADGLTLYLLANFMLTEAEDYATLSPKLEAQMVPVALSISNNYQEMEDLAAALDKAIAHYPGADFGEGLPFPYISGNMHAGQIVSTTLDGDWVVCAALAGPNGTVSAWGQGNLETAEGSLVLLLSMLGSVIQ